MVVQFKGLGINLKHVETVSSKKNPYNFNVHMISGTVHTFDLSHDGREREDFMNQWKDTINGDAQEMKGKFLDAFKEFLNIFSQKHVKDLEVEQMGINTNFETIKRVSTLKAKIETSTYFLQKLNNWKF